jgi:hypothetical protein
MINGIMYASLAWVSLKARTAFVRFWGQFFLLLVPASLLVPTNLLFRHGLVIASIGGEAITIYELLCSIIAISFIVVGTKNAIVALALPGVLGLSVFVFRVTYLHFEKSLAWPLTLAIVGGIAMSAGLGFSIVRSKRQHQLRTKIPSETT